jgi:tetratricopeptide (TPR) repeat protein
LKKQFILVAAGVVLVALLFFFGKTEHAKKPLAATKEDPSEKSFDIQQFISAEKAKLSPESVILLSKMENGISRGDVVAQQIKANEALAAYWKDSVKSYEPYVFYISEAAKLDNSEKKLTFAARLFLDNLRSENDEAKLKWETNEAIGLFERAIKLNPENDDLRIGLGSCYIFGKGRNGNPQETMQGIQELLAVVRKDSTNMKAQLVLGIGGLVSGQVDKALERLKKVVAAEPNNIEALTFLAQAYGAKGEKELAVKYYNTAKRLVNDPHFTQEVDAKIQELK